MSQSGRISETSHAGFIATLTGDLGGAISPIAGNINLTGTTPIVVTGNPLTATLDIALDGTVPSTFATDAGNATPALNILTVAGGTNIGTTGAGSTVTVNLDDTITLTRVNALTFDTNVAAAGVTLVGTTLSADGTDANININITPKGTGTLNLSYGLQNYFPIFGVGGAINNFGPMNNGTLIIGSTGATPVIANLTAGAGIAIANGAGSITITNTFANDAIDNIVTDTGGPVLPVLNSITVTGGDNITTNGLGNVLTISVDGCTTNSLLYGNASHSIGSLGLAGNGMIPIGVLGGAPILANITAGAGCTVTNGAGSITIGTSGVIANTYTTDAGNAVPAAGVLTVTGGRNIGTTGAGSTVTINLDALTDGQLFIGNTGNPATAATLSNGNNITCTGGAGSISIAVTGTTQDRVQVGSAAGALSSLGAMTNGQLVLGSTGATPVVASLTAGTGISTTVGAGSLTVNAVGGGLTWTEVVAGGVTAGAINNGYICNNAALVSILLPATAAVGSVIRLVGKGAGLCSITQNASQYIRFGNVTSTVGVGGSVAATLQYDAIEIVCTTTNNGWTVLSAVGNWTVT